MMNTLTHSMMQCFQDCRQKYQYRYVDEIVPVTSASALYFGSAIHRGLESWFKYGIKDAALLAIECQDMPEPEIIRAKALLEKYIEQWSPEQFEVVEVEYEFGSPIRNPETNRSSHVWRLRGKVDGLVRYKGELFILEHKTTSKCDGAYIDRILIDSQIATYASAIESVIREPVAGAIYDILVKPQTRFKEGETDEEFEARKAALIAKSKTGTSKTQKQERETPEQFRERVLADISPDNFRREIVRFEAGDLRDHQVELWHIAKAMHKPAIFKNTGNCTKFSGCPYLNLCRAKGDLACCEGIYEHRRAHEELTEEADHV